MKGPVPRTGHVTARGWWHPGAIDGCPKCQPSDRPQPQWSTSTCPRSRGRVHIIDKIPGSPLYGQCVACGYQPPKETR